MFAKSVPLRRCHTRPAYLLRLLCPWVMRGDYPLVLSSAAGCVTGSYARR